jgi:hypothetical protein
MQNKRVVPSPMSLASPLAAAASPMSVSSPVASPILTVKPAVTTVNVHAPVVRASATPISDEVDDVFAVKPAATMVNAHASVVRASATPIVDSEWPVFVQFQSIVVQFQFQFPTIVESMNGKMVGTTLSSVSA